MRTVVLISVSLFTLLSLPFASLTETTMPLPQVPTVRRVWFQHLATWGAADDPAGGFASAYRLATDPLGGLVFISEREAHRIQVRTSGGSQVGAWGGLGSNAGEFVHPAGIVVSSQGRVYVLDQGNERVQALSPRGEPLRAWEVGQAYDISLGPADAVGSADCIYLLVQEEGFEVRVFSETGELMERFRLWDDAGREVAPALLAVSPLGLLYAVDLYRYRILAFSLQGRYLFEWPFQRAGVTGLAVGPEGLVYASEADGGTHVYGVSGIHLANLPVSGASGLAATAGNPALVFLACGDRIHVYRQYVGYAGSGAYLPLVRKLGQDHQLPTSTPTSSPTHAPTAGPTPWVDTFEPNNSFEQAYGPLAPGIAYRSYIWTDDDQDYYRFEIRNLDPILLSMSGGPLAGDYDLYLYDADRNRLVKSERAGHEEQIVYLPLRLGSYYILVRPYRGSSRQHPYTLVAIFGDTPPTATPTWLPPYPPPVTTPTRPPHPTVPRPTHTPTVATPTRPVTPGTPTPTPRR